MYRSNFVPCLAEIFSDSQHTPNKPRLRKIHCGSRTAIRTGLLIDDVLESMVCDQFATDPIPLQTISAPTIVRTIAIDPTRLRNPTRPVSIEPILTPPMADMAMRIAMG